MKRISKINRLIFASLLMFVFATQSWAVDNGHPWEDLLNPIAESENAQVVNEIVDVLNSDLSSDQKAQKIEEILRSFEREGVETVLRTLMAVQKVKSGGKADDGCIRCLQGCNRAYCHCVSGCDVPDDQCWSKCLAKFIACIIMCDCNWQGVHLN